MDATLDHLTDYQKDTIRAAVEIYNCLPICLHHQTKHVHPNNPHIQDYELLILQDAGCIMDEFGIRPRPVPDTYNIEVEGITTHNP